MTNLLEIISRFHHISRPSLCMHAWSSREDMQSKLSSTATYDLIWTSRFVSFVIPTNLPCCLLGNELGCRIAGGQASLEHWPLADEDVSSYLEFSRFVSSTQRAAIDFHSPPGLRECVSLYGRPGFVLKSKCNFLCHQRVETLNLQQAVLYPRT